MNYNLILKAAKFSAQKHSRQRKKDEFSTPYVNHPIAVSLVISEIGGIKDPEVLAAALLHDTIENTETTAEELEAEKEMRKLLEKLHASTQLISKHAKSVNHSCFHSQDTGTKTYWAKATSYRSISL